jgi:hypothetical protein
MHRKKRGNEICFVNKTLQNRARKKHAGLFATGTKKYFQYGYSRHERVNLRFSSSSGTPRILHEGSVKF